MITLDKSLIAKLNLKDPLIWLATWGGCGFLKPAPGTWGTLGGLPFGVALLALGGLPLLLAGIGIVSVAGYYAAARFEKASRTHDAGAIVVDEVAGVWLTLLAAPLSWPGVLAAFALFRLFDIRKPWPVSFFDRKPGAFGVMTDDLAAGVYAALCLGGLRYAGLV